MLQIRIRKDPKFLLHVIIIRSQIWIGVTEDYSAKKSQQLKIGIISLTVWCSICFLYISIIQHTTLSSCHCLRKDSFLMVCYGMQVGKLRQSFKKIIAYDIKHLLSNKTTISIFSPCFSIHCYSPSNIFYPFSCHCPSKPLSFKSGQYLFCSFTTTVGTSYCFGISVFNFFLFSSSRLTSSQRRGAGS